MKSKKLFALLLTFALSVGMMTFTWTANGQNAESDAAKEEIPNLVIPYAKIQRGNVNGVANSEIDDAYEDAERGTVVKISPLPKTTARGSISIDGYNIDSLGIDMTKYNYLTVEYKFSSDVPNSVKPYFTFHPGPQKSLTKKAQVRCVTALEREKWSTFTVNIGSALKPLVAQGKKNLSQIHFTCFGDIPPSAFAPYDYLFVRNFIFSAENPNPNAEYELSFESGSSSAKGKDPENLKGKPGDTVIIPEIPYTVDGLIAAGWYSEADGKLYKGGDKYIISEGGTSFVVRWMEIFVPEDIVELEFPSYFNGIVNGTDTAKANTIEYDGYKVIEITPKPDSEKGGSIALDGWSYGGAKLNIDGYETLFVLYKYVSDNPVKGVKPMFNIMKQTTFSGMTRLTAREELIANRWAIFSVDLSPTRARKLEGVDPIIIQGHLLPLGETNVKTLDANDRIYVVKVFAIPKKSTAVFSHDSYMKGYDDGTFGISDNMTRAEACTIVARLTAGDDAAVPADKVSAFADVTADKWYHKYVSYVESLGYLGSYSGSFEPDKAITRAEFVELVYNMGLLADNGKNGTFTDVPEDHARAAVIAAAGKAGLVNGYANGDGTFSFKPDNTITRAEVVKVINNAYGRVPSKDGIPGSSRNVFSDVTEEHWAYAEITDAAVSHISYVDENGHEVWITGADEEEDNFKPDYEAGLAKAKEVQELFDKRVEEIKTAPNGKFETKGNTYYVSSSTGNDSNSGTSPEAPFATAKKASAAASNDDIVLFKRGDMWRETWETTAGVTYSAYGEGEKPIFNGNSLGDLADESKWTLLEGTTNIWKLSEKTTDIGNIIINGGEKTFEKIAPKLSGTRYLIDNTPVELKDMFSKDETFVSIYKDVVNSSADINSKTSDLYVRCDAGNPGKIYDSIEVAHRGSIIRVNSNCTIDNIKLLYTGGHGIGMGTVNNVKFTNLEIGWIGGCVQLINANGSLTRYGNGIEVYGGCNGYTVENCYIYQCYDAGVTHQYSSGGGTNPVTEENVYFTNNVIDKCIYNIEYFMGKADSADVKRVMKNINYKNNLLARSGFGWGASPTRSASVKGWEMSYNESDGFVIENNIFFMDRFNACDLGSGSAVWLPKFKGNTYIQKYGNSFTKIGANGNKQYMFNGKAAEILQKNIGETEAKLFYIPAETEIK